MLEVGRYLLCRYRYDTNISDPKYLIRRSARSPCVAERRWHRLSVAETVTHTTTTPHPTLCGWRLCRYTRSCVRRELTGLLRQSPDWRSKEDDRQVATCPQLGSTNHLEHAQVRPGTHSFPAKSATVLAGRCRSGSVQSLRPDVQMSAQDGSWIPVYLLPTRLRHLWPSPPAIGWLWSSWFPTCETCFVRRTLICIRRPFALELTSCLP